MNRRKRKVGFTSNSRGLVRIALHYQKEKRNGMNGESTSVIRMKRGGSRARPKEKGDSLCHQCEMKGENHQKKRRGKEAKKGKF